MTSTGLSVRGDYFIVERMWTHARAWLSRELFGFGTT